MLKCLIVLVLLMIDLTVLIQIAVNNKFLVQIFPCSQKIILRPDSHPLAVFSNIIIYLSSISNPGNIIKMKYHHDNREIGRRHIHTFEEKWSTKNSKNSQSNQLVKYQWNSFIYELATFFFRFFLHLFLLVGG